MPNDAPRRILETACDLIATEGLDGVRIARVARQAGVSTSLVHHYFSTREELLERALLRSFVRAADDRFGESSGTSGSASRALAAALHESLPESGESRSEWTLWVELWLRAVRDPELKPVAAGLYRSYRDWIGSLIEAGIERGEFEPALPAGEIADLAMALLDGTGIRLMLDDPGMEVERAVRLIVGVLAPLLGVSPEALA